MTDPDPRDCNEPLGQPEGVLLRAWRRRSVPALVAAAVALVLIVGLLVMSRRGQQPAAPAPPALVSVLQPRATPVASLVSFNGTINARYEMPVGTDGEVGRIASVLVEAGDHVRAQQVLARLDTSVVAPQVASLEAALEQARAEADLAAADYRRAQSVAPAGALSKEEVERRHAVAITAAAKVRVAQAQLAEARGRLARTQIRASAAGVVLTRRAEVGQIATPGGEPLFRIARGGEVELRGLVAEQDLPRLKLGQSAEVRVTGVALPFTGNVWLVGAVIDPQTRMGSVRVALKPHPDLRPGAFARASITADRVPRVVLPQTAILGNGTETYVYLVNERNETVRQAVHVQGTSPDGVIIDTGLSPSDRVIASAGAFLHDGEKVQPTAAAPGDAPP